MTRTWPKPSSSAEHKPQGLAVAPDRDELEPPRLGDAGHARSRFAVDIHHGAGAARQQLGEQAKLLREIILEARVVVQMIARDIGEGAGRERDAVDAALLQAVARGFEREMGDAVLGKRGEDRVQLDRVGRGVLEHLGAARADDADRAEACRVESLPRPELAHEGGNRGLAVGAGDGDRGLRLKRRRSARRSEPGAGADRCPR